MDRKKLIKDTPGRQNSMKLFMDFALLDKARIIANKNSKNRGLFPDDDLGMKVPPIRLILKNFKVMKRTMSSIFKSVRLIKKFEQKEGYKQINQQQFELMYNHLKELGIDQIGYVKISEKDVFKHMGEPLGVPYEHVLIFTDEQDKEKILTSPSPESMLAVGEIYGTTGNASNEVSELLDKMGFGAMPSHSLGGSVDYTKLAYMANLGYIGRHGVLIEPKSGPNHRIGAVYTNIDNLGDFFDDNQDYTWIADFCAKCGKCVRICPAKAIYETPRVDENGFVTCIDYKKCDVEFGTKYGCNYCVAVCPFTTVGYDKIRSKFVKTKEKFNKNK